MKAGLFAGGAGWGAYLVGVFSYKRPTYDSYIGTSTGALIALFLALGRIDERFYEYLLHEYSNTSNREMYGWLHPFKKNGKISIPKMTIAFLNMIRNKRNYAYDITTALEDKIRSYFKETHFHQLRGRKIDVIVTVKNADMRKSRTLYKSILEEGMTYERFVKWVVASASIPFFAKPIVINNFQYVDGGVLDPVPSELVEKYDSVDVWLMHSKQSEQEVSSPATTWLKMATNLYNDIRYEIKVDDINAVTNANIKYSRHLDWNSANFDPKLMRDAINKGIQAAKEGRI